MTDRVAVAWLRDHHASVRFDKDGTVLVTVGGFKRRRPSLAEAVTAVQEDLARLEASRG